MADHGLGRFRALAYEPGNPEFPTLPDGIPTPHVGRGGRTPGLAWRLPDLNVLEKWAADGNDTAGWFFDGIWRSPVPVEFGSITQPKQRTLNVHNTFRTNQQLTAVDMTAIAGLTLVSPGLPITIEAFESITLTFEASVAGDAAFDAEVLLTVDGVVLPVRMTGRRVIIFNAKPQRPIVERLTWVTDNMVSVNGKEQAFSLRHAPRSTVKIEQRHTDDVTRAIQLNQMQAVGFLRCGVQLWWQSREVTAAILDTDTVIQIDTENMEIANGDLLSVVSPDYNTVLEVEVQSFSPTAVTLTQAIGVAYPLQTSIMPVRFGFAKSKMNLATFATAAQDMRLVIDLIEYVAIGALDMAYFDTHPIDGLPIITHPAFYDGQTRTESLVNKISYIDGRTGDIHSEQREPLGRPGQPVLVHINSLADQMAWRRFLHFVRGSWGEFYVPTWTNDLPLKNALLLGTNTFTTPVLGMDALLGGTQAPRRDVEVVVGGVRYFRRVTDVSSTPTEEVVTLSSIIPGAGSVDPADVRISWLTPMRIVGDTATFKHLRRGQAELRFNVRAVIS